MAFKFSRPKNQYTKQYIKENPLVAIDVDDVWEYIQKNIKFDKSELTDNIVKLFKNNIDIFGK